MSTFYFFLYVLLKITNYNTGDTMKVILGYVSIPLTLGITSSSTITYTRYKELDDGIDKINLLIDKNLDSLFEILKYNVKNNIHFYRMTSNLIPLATLDDVCFDYVAPYISKYKNIGDFVNSNRLRIDAHPDQFCVLNSTNPKVLENTFNILKYHCNLFRAFNFSNPKLIIHVGGNQFGKKSSVARFKNNFNKLDEEIKKMIVIENDDKIFNIKDVLYLCRSLKIPMVLDYHHYICNNEGEDIKDYLKDIFSSWNDTGLSPKIHFSSPKSKLKKEFRAHNDYIDVLEFISFLEMAKYYTKELYVMIEAKKKDEALFRLIRELKYLTNYRFVDNTTFIVE